MGCGNIVVTNCCTKATLKTTALNKRVQQPDKNNSLPIKKAKQNIKHDC